MNRKGYTLVELMITIAIIALVIVLLAVVPISIYACNKAKKRAAAVADCEEQCYPARAELSMAGTCYCDQTSEVPK